MNTMRNSRALAALILLFYVTPLFSAAIVPRPAPDLAINMGQGKQIKISQFKGKTVVLAFILTYNWHWLVGAALIVAPWPYTMFIIMPTNKILKATLGN